MRGTSRHRITRFSGTSGRPSVDALAAEEPLEVRVDGTPVAVTMRTPGHDFDLALGFCLTESIVDAPGEVTSIRYCAGRDAAGMHTYNVVDVTRRVPGPVDERLQRRVYTSSSCGVCGTASIEAVRKVAAPIEDALTVSAATLLELPARLLEAQRIFASTGGLHAAGLFDAGGTLQVAREDVGRHNAVDKVLGWAAAQGRWPLGAEILAVSGRVAFEIVQKAWRAGVPVVAAVSAPTDLAVELAVEAGITLAGFIRAGTMNVYSGGQRIASEPG